MHASFGSGDQMAWIMGSSRSGSTWLLRMLADTGEVVAIDDPHIGHHLGVWRPIPLAWAAAEGIPELTTLADVKRDKDDYFFSDRYRGVWEPALRRLLDERLSAQVRDLAGARGITDPTVVVKEPGSHAASMLLSLFPDSTLIFLIRDGRDVVDSWMDAYQGGSWAQEEGAFRVAPHGRLALIRWLASVWLFRTEAVQRSFSRQDRRRRVLVRYEDLLRRPGAELMRIARVLGLDTDEGRLNRIAANREFARAARSERGGGNFMRAANPGRWRRNLSSKEQNAMLEIMGPKLAELGYLDSTEARRFRQTTRAA